MVSFFFNFVIFFNFSFKVLVFISTLWGIIVYTCIGVLLFIVKSPVRKFLNSLCWQLLEDVRERSEVRVAAYLALVPCAAHTAGFFTRIHKLLQQEEVHQGDCQEMVWALDKLDYLYQFIYLRHHVPSWDLKFPKRAWPQQKVLYLSLSKHSVYLFQSSLSTGTSFTPALLSPILPPFILVISVSFTYTTYLRQACISLNTGCLSNLPFPLHKSNPGEFDRCFVFCLTLRML